MAFNGDFIKASRDLDTWFKGDLLTWGVLRLCDLALPPGELSLAQFLSSWDLARWVLSMVSPR